MPFKSLGLSATLITWIASSLCLPASADSTADLILSLQCRGRLDVQIWKSRTSDNLLYRSTSPLGDLSLEGGTRQATEGVQVYKFQNSTYSYWVWDGTLDSTQAGTVEVYHNNRLLMRRACQKTNGV